MATKIILEANASVTTASDLQKLPFYQRVPTINTTQRKSFHQR